MPLSPWRVAILSTGYDLIDIRAELAENLCHEGFEVFAYERAGYPVEPRVHSHDACISAIEQVDVAIVIIDKRYGGLYLGLGDVSITEREYEVALQKKKILIPCVRRSAWDERHHMFETAKQLRVKMSDDEVRQSLHPKYVDDWQVLDFIERVRKAATDNFVAIFDDSVDLCNRINRRLEGLSPWLLKQLVLKQMRSVRDSKTTTGMAFSLGDVLEQGYFLERGCEKNCVNGHGIVKLSDRKGILWTGRHRNN